MIANLQHKKYYSIGEVMAILQIPAHQLRYLEKALPNFTVTKIKGRRYYTQQNIELIKTRVKEHSHNLFDFNYNAIINQIDILINKFEQLSSNININNVINRM